jgi:hypothetical protein
VTVTGLIVVAVAVVALIAYARASSPEPGEGDVGPLSASTAGIADGASHLITWLDWWALAGLGLTTVIAAFMLERLRWTFRPAFDLHLADIGALLRQGRARSTVRRAERGLRKAFSAHDHLRGNEERELVAHSGRMRALGDEWRTGREAMLDEPEDVYHVNAVVRPVPIADGVDEEAVRVVLELEQVAHQLLRAADPFVAIVPRRDPPPALVAGRQMIGARTPRG